MKSLGIIPARGGSKGILWKNIVDLNGKPLIWYTIEAALNSKLDKVIVSTESERIAEVAVKFGCEVLMRPVELAQDGTPTLPVLQHVVRDLSEPFDAIVTLQPTSPLRKAQHINEALNIFNAKSDADSVVSVCQVPHNYTPESIYRIENGQLCNYIDSKNIILDRHKKPHYYARNGPAILITKTTILMERDSLYGGVIYPYLMEPVNSHDIDEAGDLVIAESLLKLKSNG